MSYIIHQDEHSAMGVVESQDAIVPKKPRASRAKPKVPVDPDAPGSAGSGSEKKVRAPRKKAEKKTEAMLPEEGNVKMPDLPLLTRETSIRETVAPVTEAPGGASHPNTKDGKSELSEIKKRGRPTIDKFATVSARIRGGEFTAEGGSKAKLAIYVSRVLADDKAFRPQMKDLLTELGHVDLLSVFALR